MSAIGVPGRARYGLADVARMEWIKLRTLRSTVWAMVVAVAGTVGIGVAVLGSYTSAHFEAMSPADRAGFDPTNMGLSGMLAGMVGIGVVGVLAMTGEYSSGAIRSTLAAVPDRRLVLLAKVTVFGGVALVAGQVAAFGNFVLGEAVLTPAAPHASLGQPGVLRAVALSGVYLALLGLTGLGLGTLIRHTAGALTAYLGMIFALPMLILMGGESAIRTVGRFAPMLILENSVAAVRPVEYSLPVWAGIAVIAGYAAVALGAGAVLFLRRPA